MSCECKRQGDLCDPCTDLLGDGDLYGRTSTIALLEELGTVRNSMLGKDWRVIYTEKGPVDITLAQLLGRGNA